MPLYLSGFLSRGLGQLFLLSLVRYSLSASFPVLVVLHLLWPHSAAIIACNYVVPKPNPPNLRHPAHHELPSGREGSRTRHG
jgi:hypothetical protein